MIPKIIHYCWVGGNPLPESAKKCIQSWKKYCPDYEIIEWNESNYDFTKNEYMKEALEAKKWGFVPDYARLDIIYRYGGIYLDTDVEIVKSFDELLKYEGFLGFETNEYINLGQGFGAESNNSVIKALLDSYETKHFVESDGTLNMTASPELNTDVLERMGLKRNGNRQSLMGIEVFPSEFFCPKSLNDGVVRKTKNTFSIHHFDASWFTKEQQLKKELRWKEKKKKARIKKIRSIIKSIGTKVFGEKLYKKIRGVKD